MKYLLYVLLSLPFCAYAHTSDERYVDGYVVDLSTAPIAPWVGEKTGMSFVFIDPVTLLATSSVESATLTIDISMRANKKLPETIFESKVFPIENGGFTTDYVFLEEGTYDMHLTFLDKEGRSRVAGFRKQVREGVASDAPIGPTLFFLTVLAVSTIGFLAGRFSRKEPI